MIKRLSLVLACLLLLPIISVADEAEEQLKSFLKSRTVIDQVYFNVASNSLSKSARSQLDNIVARLRTIGEQDKVLRIEGFASPEGDAAKNVNLSMYRAMAVRNYLRDKHDLHPDLFLTGYGGKQDAANPAAARRVDIALYLPPKAATALFDEHGNVEKITVK